MRWCPPVGGSIGGDSGSELKVTLCVSILEANQYGGMPRLFERLRHDDRDGLVVMLDFVAGQQRIDIEFALPELAGAGCA